MKTNEQITMMKREGEAVLVRISATMKPNGIMAMNLAGKYPGKIKHGGNGWYGARIYAYDKIADDYIFIVYDFDYYVKKIA